MAEPTFAQPERRSFLVPILLALVVLGLAFLGAARLFPATPPSLEPVETRLLPTHTVYKSQSIVLGPDQSEDVLFVASTLRVTNHLRVPISLDDFSLTFTNPDGGELVAKAAQKSDLTNLELSFPALKPLLSKPLFRESSLAPGQSLEGTVLFSLALSEPTWKMRRSAVLRIDLYHQKSLFETIPKP